MKAKSRALDALSLNLSDHRRALASAIAAAKAAGRLMRSHLNSAKAITQSTPHDIKLELDVRSQKLIEKILLRSFPNAAVLGEEGMLGDQQASERWVVDPIDGTVNFSYGIPHACVSIALQVRKARSKGQRSTFSDDEYVTVVGVVYDPFSNELWTAIRGQRARLNGCKISVSHRRKLNECIVAVGFGKDASSLAHMLPAFNQLVRRVRKMRIMGAAALGLAYVATGRMDGYLEHSIRLWDIAAGGLILECAGGDFFHRAIEGEHAYQIITNNGRLRRQLQRFIG